MSEHPSDEAERKETFLSCTSYALNTSDDETSLVHSAAVAN